MFTAFRIEIPVSKPRHRILWRLNWVCTVCVCPHLKLHRYQIALYLLKQMNVIVRDEIDQLFDYRIYPKFSAR